ncbi:hypothetical protein HRTV-24_gp17 [Halorubrum virus HRTV-24]|nr:hypothetical protein HRTV-24_gp17 [Halorubrum virus HRTV-24]UBF22036.1 hypothetical protein HRTV-15_gp17 [Halorubrum virus HRTV-15]
MKVKFLEMGNRGWAEYDESSDTYSWEYDGDREEIIELLSALDDGPLYDEMDSGEPVVEANRSGAVAPSEMYVTLPWDEQIRELARWLRYYGAQTILIEN